MKIGDEIKVEKRIGKITYIHPKGRFVVVKFKNYSEAFPIVKNYDFESDRSNYFYSEKDAVKIEKFIMLGRSKTIICDRLGRSDGGFDMYLYKNYGTTILKKVKEIITERTA